MRTIPQIGDGEIKLARSVARYYGRRTPSLADEFESAAYVAIWEAARSFDPSIASFSTHLVRRVRGACLDVMRWWGPMGYKRGGDDPPAIGRVSDDMADVLPDLRCDEAAIGHDAEWVRSLFKPWGGTGAALAAYVLGEVERIEDAGRLMGVGQSRASRIKIEVFAQVRERLAAG